MTAKTSATSGSNCWGENYTIDQWGNLTVIGALSGYTGCTQENLSVSATTNNQLSFTGVSYDAAGNTQSDGAYQYIYNAESETTYAGGVTYTYDGDGNRLEKSSGKLYWYGAGTEILDESDTSGNFTNEYVFFGGKRVAMRIVSSGTIYYYEDDMLGSARTMVQAGQTSLCYDADFYPFGGERDITTSCGSNYKFEGKERDTETGNDDFGARYYTPRLGRWLSADWSAVPAPVPYANLANPQTLNLYAMVSDNPETFADLDGHCGGDTAATSACETPPGANAGSLGEPAPAAETDQKNGTGKPPSPSQLAAQLAAGPALAEMEKAVQEAIDKVVKPLIESAAEAGENALPALEGAASDVIAPVAVAANFLLNPRPTASPRSDELSQKALPPDAVKLKKGQGYRDKNGNIWKKDKFHKDHWDVTDRKGRKIREVTFDGRELWPNGPKNKN